MNHDILAISDKIALLAEIEHERHHLARSAHVTTNPDKKFFYQVKAEQAKQLRRKVQAKWLNTDEEDWCLVKSSARLKWLNEEVLKEDVDLYSEIEQFTDDIIGNAFGVDVSGCKACVADRDEV